MSEQSDITGEVTALPQVDLLIREATLEDLEPLVRFTLDEAREAEGRVEETQQISEAIEAALLDPTFKARYFVAVDMCKEAHDQRSELKSLVGHCSVTREWSDWNNTYYWWITSMYVHPESRGRGVMSALLSKVDEKAKEAGAPEVRIYVHEHNERALHAWRREGFESAPYWMASRKVDREVQGME